MRGDRVGYFGLGETEAHEMAIIMAPAQGGLHIGFPFAAIAAVGIADQRPQVVYRARIDLRLLVVAPPTDADAQTLVFVQIGHLVAERELLCIAELRLDIPRLIASSQVIPVQIKPVVHATRSLVSRLLTC